MNMEKEPICNRCGKCCHYWIDGVFKKCKYLVKLPSGKTVCRIYSKKDRIGKELDKDSKGRAVYCDYRQNFLFNYPGCDYNHPDWREVTKDEFGHKTNN